VVRTADRGAAADPDARTRSWMVRYGDSAGTSTVSGSCSSRAIGVASVTRCELPPAIVAPTMPRPIIITSRSFPYSSSSRDSATVPWSPARLKTAIGSSTIPDRSAMDTAVRAETSYPPPGTFGTMIRRRSTPPAASSAAQPVTSIRQPRTSANVARIDLFTGPPGASVSRPPERVSVAVAVDVLVVVVTATTRVRRPVRSAELARPQFGTGGAGLMAIR
jgi:hypothetical protein